MLLAAVLTLTPTQPVTLPANLGQAAHAWFLDRLRAANPALADAMHAPNTERPFTVSNLWGGQRQGARQVYLAPGQPCFLRLTSIDPALSTLLAQTVLPALPGSAVSLLDAAVPITACAASAAEHPWANQIAYADLIARHTLATPPPRTITLHFASPTVFRSQGANVPLPLPTLVIDSLARRWNQTAPLAIPPEIHRFAEEVMLISRYRLWTERASFGGDGSEGVYPGFLGACSYGFRAHDRYWIGLVHLLAAFAFYAGVGARTSRGLGQARLLGGRADPRRTDNANSSRRPGLA
jgi:CRISPR-associated endoribonuclease Cas6